MTSNWEKYEEFIGMISSLFVYITKRDTYIIQWNTDITNPDITNILKQGPNTCYVALKGVCLISYSSQRRLGTPLFVTSFGFAHDR